MDRAHLYLHLTTLTNRHSTHVLRDNYQSVPISQQFDNGAELWLTGGGRLFSVLTI